MRNSARSKYLSAILLFFGGVRALAAGTVDNAVQSLSTVRVFAFGGVGFAGVTSKGETNLRYLISEPDPVALRALELVYATGTPEARAYALAGLKELNPKRFKELLAASEDSTESVAVMRGCIGSAETIGSIAKKVDRGDYSLWLEQSSAGRWSALR
jgi:hypothetical protein